MLHYLLGVLYTLYFYIIIKAQYFKDGENPIKIPLWSYVWYIK